WMHHRGVGGGAVLGGRDEVHAVRRVEIAERRAGLAGVPVLPDDPVGARIDDDDAVTVVVVDGDVAIWQWHRQRGVVHFAGAFSRSVAPEDVPLTVDDERVARAGVVGEQDAPAREGLRVRRVADGGLYGPLERAFGPDFVEPVSF